MTNDEVADGLFRESRDRLRHAKLAKTDGSFAFAYRPCQECVELALKAVLLRAGVDPPKWHDVGDVLVKNLVKMRGPERRRAGHGRLRAAHGGGLTGRLAATRD